VKYETRQTSADLIIVGAGYPGICAAIQAARMDVNVIIINDRGVLGGNNSCEIGVGVNGANDCAPINLNSREGGLMSEMLLELKYRSPDCNRYIWDTVLIDFVNREKNIKVFLNTCIDEVDVGEDGDIIRVTGAQNTTEIRWSFMGKWFVDNTGDGTLGYHADAGYMLGREAKSTYSERFAPDKADKYVIPSTLFWHTKDMGRPIHYVAPDFAIDLTKTDILKYRVIPHSRFSSFNWYYEVGGDFDHVKDREEIIAKHKALTHGIWDYIKNSGEYPEAKNYDFEYISCIPGTREYRRLEGDHVLTENDLEQQTKFDDAVGHGGWNIDLHAIHGMFDTDIINSHIFLRGIYQIPYRCGYSRNVSNLFMCGRCMSTTHAAFGSTRVIGTLATLGQAVGMAAGLCKKYSTTPQGVYEDYRKELQQRLLRADQLIVGLINTDESDIARKAQVSASSAAELKLASVMPSGTTTEQRSPLTTYVGKNVDDARKDCYQPLTETLGLSIPVIERLDSVHIKVRATCKSVLHYRLYHPVKKENYGPEKLLIDSSVEITPAESFEWIELPMGVKTGGYYLFLELENNPEIEISIAGLPLPTTQMFQRNKNTSANLWNVDTLAMADYVWNRRTDCMCFKTEPEQFVYAPRNVVNGHNRAYGLPHQWLSDPNDPQPSITLEWDELTTLDELQITFAIDTTLRIYSDMPVSVLPFLAQDFAVFATIEGEEVPVAVVQDNFQKVCRVPLHDTKTNRITVRFDRSRTGQIGVYEVRCYA
jgi:hypothetical protein